MVDPTACFGQEVVIPACATSTGSERRGIVTGTSGKRKYKMVYLDNGPDDDVACDLIHELLAAMLGSPKKAKKTTPQGSDSPKKTQTTPQGSPNKAQGSPHKAQGSPHKAQGSPKAKAQGSPKAQDVPTLPQVPTTAAILVHRGWPSSSFVGAVLVWRDTMQIEVDRDGSLETALTPSIIATTKMIKDMVESVEDDPHKAESLRLLNMLLQDKRDYSSYTYRTMSEAVDNVYAMVVRYQDCAWGLLTKAIKMQCGLPDWSCKSLQTLVDTMETIQAQEDKKKGKL